MIRFAITALLTLVFSAGYAQPDVSKKVWACAANGDSVEDLFLVEWGKRSYVKLYEARIWGQYSVDDKEKRWDFGQGSQGSAAFSAILKPSGELDYYDFREVAPGQAVEPSYFYNCRLAQG